MTVALSIGITTVMVVAGWLTITRQRQHLERGFLKSARTWAETIRRSTRCAMLTNNVENLERVLLDICEQEGIDRIRVYDHEGTIKRATVPTDLVATGKDGIPLRYDPHRGQRLHYIDETSGERMLSVSVPIENEEACAACHVHRDEDVYLGGIEVLFSHEPIETLVEDAEMTLGTGMALTVLAAVLVLGALIWRMVILPVRDITGAADRVATGDLAARIPVLSDDEMGEMAMHWNGMVEELAAARDQLQGMNEDLEARVAEKAEELKAAHRRVMLVEKMASLGKLSAVVAHEINNPLAGITTYAKLLRRRMERGELEGGSEDTGRILRLVEEESARCGRIVQNLLLFSRAPSTKKADSDLMAILERCALLVNHKAELQGVVIEMDVPSDLPPVVCDPAQVQQVLVALVMNAIEAMPEGGTLTLGAALDPENREVVLRVTDTGIGIPKDIRDSIFEPFFTTKSEGHGVGLGLAVCFGIMERHHGRLEVESKEGEGTTFRAFLPLDAPLDEEEDDHEELVR